MRIRRRLPALVCALALTVVYAAHAVPRAAVPITWSFHALGTPTFDGEPVIGKPGYVEPVRLGADLPASVPCVPSQRVVGEFEAYINRQGVVESVHSHHEPTAGNACQRRHILPVIRRWRFSPALFEGQPTPVYVWIGVALE